MLRFRVSGRLQGTGLELISIHGTQLVTILASVSWGSLAREHHRCPLDWSGGFEAVDERVQLVRNGHRLIAPIRIPELPLSASHTAIHMYFFRRPFIAYIDRVIRFPWITHAFFRCLFAVILICHAFPQ